MNTNQPIVSPEEDRYWTEQEYSAVLKELDWWVENNPSECNESNNEFAKLINEIQRLEKLLFNEIMTKWI